MDYAQPVLDFPGNARQQRRAELLARRDKSHLPYPAHSARDAKAARNILYLYNKGVLPGYELTPSLVDGKVVITKPPFELGQRHATVVANDNIRRENRKGELRMLRSANLLLLCPTIER